jgi:hypothetical protein
LIPNVTDDLLHGTTQVVEGLGRLLSNPIADEAVIKGGGANGITERKDRTGKTLKDDRSQARQSIGNSVSS